MARTDPQVNIRLPAELLQRLEVAAAENQRAFKAEIVARLESGHGHVTPNADGSKARCGGPAICAVCALEYARFHMKAEEPHRFPDRLTLRDTKVTADEGQRIYSTATGHGYEKCEYVRADIVVAAPGLLGALRDLIGLIQLVRNRDDLTTEVREALTYGHRIDAAYAAIAKAEGR